MTETINYAIIGAGVVGTAVAYELSKKFGDEVFVFERNHRIRGENQSSRNSGVIHAGIYYPQSKGPNKAKFCVEGNKMLYDFCQEHDLLYQMTGKLLVATNDREAEYLDDVLKTAQDNGVPGVRMVSKEEVQSLEPNVKAATALYVPTSGIIDPTSLVTKLYQLGRDQEVNYIFGSKIVDIKPVDDKFEITTEQNGKKEKFLAEYLINAAGLYSDEIATMVNPAFPFVMDPVRGEAAKFYKTKRPETSMKGMNVYPAPHGFYIKDKKKADVPFEEFKKLFAQGVINKTVGVHLTPTFDEINPNKIGSTVTIGPLYNAVKDKEDYASNLHPEEKFFESVKDFFPGLKLEDVSLHQTGIQARLKRRDDGKAHYDFVIEPDKNHQNCINLVGIDSPGLTSSLAIAKYVSEMLK